MQGDRLVAELLVDGPDYPWLHAQVQPGPALSELRDLFDEEVQLLNRMDDKPDGAAAWESAYLRVREAVRLIGPDGQDVPEFILHIDGGRAWWRWADEPFGDES